MPSETTQAPILVADDDPGVLRMLERTLFRYDAPLILACDGRSALEAAQKSPPALIILDVNMPKMSGYDVCAALRADAATKTIPVLILTGLRDADDEIEGLHAGADDYLPKPFAPGELVARIDALMRRCAGRTFPLRKQGEVKP